MDFLLNRPYTPLAVLGSLALLLVLIIVAPATEMLSIMMYLVFSVLLAAVLFNKGIRDIEPSFPVALFALAVMAKLIFALARYWTVVDLYGGAADAVAYHHEGVMLSPYFRSLDFSVLDWYTFRGQGSMRMAILTGLLYTIMPSSMAGSFIFFSMLAFAGSVFFFRAVRLASSDSMMSAYTVFVFFLPSVLFWPASLGKDAWVFFASGLVAWGWSTFVRKNHFWGLLVVACALLLINLVRPHIAVFMAASLVAAYMLYATRAVRSGLVYVIGGILLAVLGYYLFQSGAQFLQLDELSLEAVEGFVQDQQEATSIGGSSYQTVSVFTPQGAVVGFVTALARPFPWEAHNLQMLMISLETVAWLAFCWFQRHKFIAKLKSLRSDPLAAYALIYSVITLLALTSIGNFGIIARQRVMVLPFLWMLFV